MSQHFEDFCEDKAREGDGRFAIAYAIMMLAREHKSLTSRVGDLDEVSGAMHSIVQALENLEPKDG